MVWIILLFVAWGTGAAAMDEPDQTNKIFLFTICVVCILAVVVQFIPWPTG